MGCSGSSALKAGGSAAEAGVGAVGVAVVAALASKQEEDKDENRTMLHRRMRERRDGVIAEKEAMERRNRRAAGERSESDESDFDKMSDDDSDGGGGGKKKKGKPAKKGSSTTKKKKKASKDTESDDDDDDGDGGAAPGEDERTRQQREAKARIEKRGHVDQAEIDERRRRAEAALGGSGGGMSPRSGGRAAPAAAAAGMSPTTQGGAFPPADHTALLNQIDELKTQLRVERRKIEASNTELAHLRALAEATNGFVLAAPPAFVESCAKQLREAVEEQRKMELELVVLRAELRRQNAAVQAGGCPLPRSPSELLTEHQRKQREAVKKMEAQAAAAQRALDEKRAERGALEADVARMRGEQQELQRQLSDARAMLMSVTSSGGSAVFTAAAPASPSAPAAAAAAGATAGALSSNGSAAGYDPLQNSTSTPAVAAAGIAGFAAAAASATPPPPARSPTGPPPVPLTSVAPSAASAVAAVAAPSFDRELLDEVTKLIVGASVTREQRFDTVEFVIEHCTGRPLPGREPAVADRREFELCGSQLGDPAAQLAAMVLRHNKELATVGLGDCALGDFGASQLSLVLSTCKLPNLRALLLAGNDISLCGALQLVTAACHNASIRELRIDLSDNPVYHRAEDVAAMRDELQRCADMKPKLKLILPPAPRGLPPMSPKGASRQQPPAHPPHMTAGAGGPLVAL